MSNKYLSVGIDHGTTNSSIAVMESSGPRVIKVNGVDEIMPSAVYIDQRGRTIVGAPAYRAMLANKMHEGDGYTGYKLRIGQGDRYEFANAKKSFNAPQLGGLVIGALLKAYQEDGGQQPQAAVITVPAKFENSACEGTREAARLAGLKCYPQLQEPIAAAMAYGFSSADRRAQWMVFDLGGGTLDISLVIVRDGKMVVPEEGHAGDNRLGGRKFDRELLDYALTELRKEYALDGFSESNKNYRQAWGTLLMACEQAKIHLSMRKEAVIELSGAALCKDDQGKDVKLEIPITRMQYEKMIAADVDKAVHICRTLIATNRLTARDLTRLILIGGPTKTPYIQQALAEGLGVELNSSIDPMTAVAVGAAIHAATVELPEELRTTVQGADLKGGVQVTLKYERAPKVPTCSVAGMVAAPDGDPAALQIEIRRHDGWSSGRLPVGSDGLFTTDVNLVDEGRPHLSKFTTEVLDATGKILATVQEPEVWFPLPEGNARLANSLLIAVKGNKTETLIKKGVELPATDRGHFETLKEIRRGSQDDVLRINVLEGVTNLFGAENERADYNVHVGTLAIPGDQISGDIPKGAGIEITLMQDASREIHCRAYIPSLDQEFEGRMKAEAFEVSLDDVVKRFDAAKVAVEEAEKLQKEFPVAGLDEKFGKIRQLNVMEEIAKEVGRARNGEREAFYRAYRRTLELAGALDEIQDAQTAPRIRRDLRHLKSLVDANDEKVVRAIEAEFEAAIKSNDKVALTRIAAAVAELDVKVRRRPYVDVLVDLGALSGIRVSVKQKELFDKAADLMTRIDKKGGVESLTDSDLSDLSAAHRSLAEAYPDLQERRQKFFESLPPGQSPESIDIQKSR